MNTLCPPNIESVADLKQVQRLMAQALMRPLTDDDELQPTWVDGQDTEEVAGQFMKPNDRLTAFERLEIYSRQYWFRLLDCLYDDYPGLRSLLGQEQFHAMCISYLEQYPSESFTLRNLGKRLEQFLRDEPHWAGGKIDMALDIVRFEWAQILAFDEECRKPVVGDDLLGLGVEEMRLGLQPYLVLLELDYAVDEFFLAVRDQDSSSRSEASNAISEAPIREEITDIAPPIKQPVWLAVHRYDNELFYLRLEHEAYLTLSAIRKGETIAAALEQALANADPTLDWATKIREWFENWAELGWFAS